MDNKQVLELLVKGLKDIKNDLEKKDVKDSISDMKSAVSDMKENVKKIKPKEKLEKDLNETTAKVNTPKAMANLQAKAAKNLAAKPAPHQPPPSNEITKKVMKSQTDEKTKEESAGKTVEKISQGSKNTTDAAKNLMDKENYPQHTQEKAKKEKLNPFMLARKNKK